MESIRNSMDPRVKGKTWRRTWRFQEINKIQNNQSLYQDCQPDMNPLKAIKQKNWKSWWRTVYGRLMNKSIARSRTIGSPIWRENTMRIDCSSTPDLSLYKSLYYLQHPWVRILHQMNAKNVLQKKLSKERMQSSLKTLKHTRKILLYANKKKKTWRRTSSA